YVNRSNDTFNILHNDTSKLWIQTLQTNLGAIVSSPVLGENGMLYFGSVNSNIYALHVPTVLSRYAWPTFRGNLRHTGNAASLIVRPIFSTVSNMVFQISGPFGLTNVVESSTD